ncbi:unnamed protein product [Rotaria socialis]|uniref:Uncharacterized protein n=1 Tax=Rotaria socialis TaxID=392032 RepID=A0A820JKJ9_9BILA|nr:unnamed protein product [Rotaria socialis]CAF3380164.1 unnamed protein product [Rotaria socialis]CAF4325658.1 unnamed protein product [Rotaria socialis]CAF4465236.1 unnamed protein product [Rotaria socialis]
MATTAPAANTSDTTGNDNLPNVDQAQGSSPSSNVLSPDRVITPVASNVQPQPTTSGFASVSSSVTPTFTALKGAALQQVVGHPFAYVRVLMQMGYEPLPAVRGRTLFGKEALYYPHAFRYLKYVYKIDGFVGLYRGFGCSLLSKAVCWYTTTKVDEILGPVKSQASNDQTNASWNKCIDRVLREIQTQSWGILISHPFQVMAIRCMGQFVGREKAYSSINIFQNVQEIYDRQGIGGFFVGLMPRWLLEISAVIITNVLVHLLKTQIPSPTEMGSLFDYVASFIAQTVTYPLSVVSTVTAINGSGLRAGMLPITPIYDNWHQAYNYLQKTEQLKRGSSFFNRAALGSSGLPAVGSHIPHA